MAWRFSLAAHTSAVSREILPVADSIQWVRRPHRKKQSQVDRLAVSKLNFRLVIAAKKFLRRIARPVIKPMVLGLPVNIRRLLVQNLQPAGRGVPR